MEPTIARRELLAALAGAAAAVALPTRGAAEDRGGNKVWSPGGLPHDLPAGALTQPRARVLRKPPFDLNDPLGRSLARLRVLENFEGKTSYLAVLSRWLLCPPNRPVVPYFDEVEVNTMFLTEPNATPAAGRDDLAFVQNGIFTRMPVDPVSLTPIREIRNPLTGRTVETPDTLFAAATPMTIGKPGAADVLLQPERPHFRVGRDLRFVMLDIRAGDGPHQPRVDTATWSVRHDVLMDPAIPMVEADYSYTALLRASVFASTGLAPDDPTQLLIIKSGVKVNAVDALPDFVKTTIGRHYPDRLAIV